MCELDSEESSRDYLYVLGGAFKEAVWLNERVVVIGGRGIPSRRRPARNEKYGPVTRDRAVAQEIISRWKGLTIAMSYLLPVRCEASVCHCIPVKTYGDVKISASRLAEESAGGLRTDVFYKGGCQKVEKGCGESSGMCASVRRSDGGRWASDGCLFLATLEPPPGWSSWIWGDVALQPLVFDGLRRLLLVLDERGQRRLRGSRLASLSCILGDSPPLLLYP